MYAASKGHDDIVKYILGRETTEVNWQNSYVRHFFFQFSHVAPVSSSHITSAYFSSLF